MIRERGCVCARELERGRDSERVRERERQREDKGGGRGDERLTRQDKMTGVEESRATGRTTVGAHLFH